MLRFAVFSIETLEFNALMPAVTRITFQPEMHQMSFGGRASFGPAGESSASADPSCGRRRGGNKGKDEKEGWERKEGREGRKSREVSK